MSANGGNAAKSTPASESVYLDGGLLDPILGQKRRDLDALITLQLDDLAHLLVVDEGAVAGEFL